MKLFLSYVRLIRPLNLVMIVFTMYMVWLFFELPLEIYFDVGEVKPINVPDFYTMSLFALSFVLLAAGGYIINDYYDIIIDKTNKPDKVIIGNKISVRSALLIYWLLNITGVIIGFWSCYKAEIPVLGAIFLFYLIGLWFYSYKLKSTFLFGNILVALFLALVPLASAYFGIQGDLKFPEFLNPVFIYLIRIGTLSIAGFAFISTLIREILKDMEDITGDNAAGCRTVPIVIGIKKTKIFVQILLALMVCLLIRFQFWCFSENLKLSIHYIIAFIQLPCILVIWKTQKAANSKNYHVASTWVKIIMLTGICYLWVFTYDIIHDHQYLLYFIKL